MKEAKRAARGFRQAKNRINRVSHPKRPTGRYGAVAPDLPDHFHDARAKRRVRPGYRNQKRKLPSEKYYLCVIATVVTTVVLVLLATL